MCSSECLENSLSTPLGEFQGQFKRQLWMLLCGFGTNIQYLRQPYTSSNAFSLKTSMNSYTKSIVKSNCSFNFKNKRANCIAITQISQFLNSSNVFRSLWLRFEGHRWWSLRQEQRAMPLQGGLRRTTLWPLWTRSEPLSSGQSHKCSSAIVN